MKPLSVKAYDNDKHIILILILNFIHVFNSRPKYIRFSVDYIFGKNIYCLNTFKNNELEPKSITLVCWLAD